MPSQSFLQLFGILAGMADKRQQRELAERELSQRETQFKEATRQFEINTKDKETAEALKALGSASMEARPAILQLLKSGHFSPDEISAFSSFASGQPVDPSVFGAQSAQRGYANATPQQRGTIDQETAARAFTGMNMGQLGQSQLTGAMASGGPPPGQLGQMFNQPATQVQVPFGGGATTQANIPSGSDIWSRLSQNFIARQASGYTPEQFGLQQSQVALGWANLREEDRKLMAESGLKELFGKVTGQLTEAEKAQAMQGIGKLLDDINNARSDASGNMARQRLIGLISMQLGLPATYFTPQPGAPTTAPTSATPFRSFIQGQPGFAPGVVNPRPAPPMSGLAIPPIF